MRATPPPPALATLPLYPRFTELFGAVLVTEGNASRAALTGINLITSFDPDKTGSRSTDLFDPSKLMAKVQLLKNSTPVMGTPRGTIGVCSPTTSFGYNSK